MSACIIPLPLHPEAVNDPPEIRFTAPSQGEEIALDPFGDVQAIRAVIFDREDSDALEIEWSMGATVLSPTQNPGAAQNTVETSLDLPFDEFEDDDGRTIVLFVSDGQDNDNEDTASWTLRVLGDP